MVNQSATFSPKLSIEEIQTVTPMMITEPRQTLQVWQGCCRPWDFPKVTNFECGGYSIRISCSILFTDLLLKKEFLKIWADIHNNVINKSNNKKLPLFYIPGLKTTNGSSSNMITLSSSKNLAETMIFNIKAQAQSLGSEWCRKMALACLEEEENNLTSIMGGEFSLFVNESFGAIKVKSCSKKGVLKPEIKPNKEFNHGKWDDLGANGVSFDDGNKPALISY
ncbi:FAD/NAD(P)-binding oxidoreductase family protein isoform 1 [Hibiscus syriacus]|uniref:FAD/NAD(P)-binding oxidoreductase family protein isoform 1 n=1 Tax=Hibiscus syriacus TaxID=106335 RepID=A0A6A2XQ71_HIBSY|nr:FAD/NAD(P)-binding oxidoreductase family protein isoform 1 [Hibiscus syriacus]